MPEPIVVRESQGMFYVVNVTDVPVSVRLHLDGPGRAIRMSSEQYVEAPKK